MTQERATHTNTRNLVRRNFSVFTPGNEVNQRFRGVNYIVSRRVDPRKGLSCSVIHASKLCVGLWWQRSRSVVKNVALETFDEPSWRYKKTHHTRKSLLSQLHPEQKVRNTNTSYSSSLAAFLSAWILTCFMRTRPESLIAATASSLSCFSLFCCASSSLAAAL